MIEISTSKVEYKKQSEWRKIELRFAKLLNNPISKVGCDWSRKKSFFFDQSQTTHPVYSELEFDKFHMKNPLDVINRLEP